MRRRLFHCPGCHRNTEGGEVFCDLCAADYKRLYLLYMLILRKYPQLKCATIPDALIRLWKKHVENDPDALQRVEELEGA